MLPGYFKPGNVYDVTPKMFNDLSLFTRPTFSWDIECEWSGVGNRPEAWMGYNTTFSDPKMAKKSGTASIALASCAVVAIIVGLCFMCCFGINKEPESVAVF